MSSSANTASNVAGIGSTLEALIFSIYCVAIASLSDVECLQQLGLPKWQRG